MHLRGIVLFLVCLPGGARRSVRLDGLQQDAQKQKGSLTNGLEALADSRESLIPGALRTGLSRRAGLPRVGGNRVVNALATHDAAVQSDAAIRQVQDLIAEMTSSPAALKKTLEHTPRLQDAAEMPAVANALDNPATLAQEMQVLEAMSQLLTGMRGTLSDPLKRQRALEQLQRLNLGSEGPEVPAAQPQYVGSLAVARAGIPSMQFSQLSRTSKKITSLETKGVFEAREVSESKPPVRLLNRVNELRILSSIADAGLLSKAEEAGVFTKLEELGAFSTLEKLLPLVDKVGLLGILENLLDVPANVQVLLAAALLGGEGALIGLVPDDNAALIAVQVLTALLAGGGAVTLLASAFFFSLLQGEN